MNRIVLLGDQICLDYLPVLTGSLKDRASLWAAPEPVANSVELLVAVREWLMKRQPELVLLSPGILDTRRVCYGESERLVPLEAFARNVKLALKMVRDNCATKPVWATMAPVDLRRVKDAGAFGYDNETISLYNEEAKAIARKLEVPVIDIYGIVKAASRDDSCRPDGWRFDERSSDFLAAKVAARLVELSSD